MVKKNIKKIGLPRQRWAVQFPSRKGWLTRATFLVRADAIRYQADAIEWCEDESIRIVKINQIGGKRVK